MSGIGRLKERALVNLKGSWSDAVIVTFVFLIITTGINTVLQTVFGNERGMIFSVIWVLIIVPIIWSYTIMFLDHRRRERNVFRIGNLFQGYKDTSRIFTTYLLTYVYIFLWTLLLFVPGIIKAISYSQVSYVLKDHPEMSNNAAIEESMRLMEGHKMDYFLLVLSFIGWVILSVLTMGIGFLLLYPYYESTLAEFYEDVRDDADGEEFDD